MYGITIWIYENSVLERFFFSRQSRSTILRSDFELRLIRSREIKLCVGQLVQRIAVFIDTVFINPVTYKSVDY